MSVINTNYLALVSQNNLTKSQNALGTAIERLSSGLRINSAKDDAAGQAIANRMTSQITGLNQAQRNANDGISVAQTAEGALNQVNDNLQRIRELTVQAQNQTNSDEDLGSIQAEITQRLTEINRISEQTDFNGVKVLSADRGLTIQVGANDSEAITVNLQKINSESLKLSTFNVDGSAKIDNTAAKASDLQNFVDNGMPGGSVVKVSDTQYTLNLDNTRASGSALLAGLADGKTVTSSVTDGNKYGFASGTITAATFTADGEGNFSIDMTAFDVSATGAVGAELFSGTAEGRTQVNYKFNNGNTRELFVDSAGAIWDSAADGNRMRVVDATGELTIDAGAGGTSTALTASLLMQRMGDSTGSEELTIQSGKNEGMVIKADGAAGTAVNIDNAKLTAAEVANYSRDFSATLTSVDDAFTDADFGLSTSNNVTVTFDADGTIGAAGTGILTGDVYINADGGKLTTTAQTSNTLYVRDTGIVNDINGRQYFLDQTGKLTTEASTDGERTTDPLKALDDALKMVDTLRSDLGAIQNRFESAITNLQTNSTNLQAARSRIQDADYAVEVANMTRAQILQQAGTSVLAQANQIPQGVLSLLR